MVKNLPETWKTWVQSLDQEDPLKKEMATHSSILGLPWWLRGWIPWKREWPPSLVFFPGEFYGQRSLVGYGPWAHRESNTPEILTFKMF